MTNSTTSPTATVRRIDPEHLLWAWIVGTGVFVAACGPLLHQEAYYGLYARHLALSYFDHPPLIGWLIRAAIAVFGDSALAIRAVPLLAGLAFAWATVRWIGLLGFGRDARRAALFVLATAPLLAGNRVLAMPDAPLCAFAALALVDLWQARTRPSLGRWLRIGMWFGGALLSKYTAVFLPFGALVVGLLDPALRRQAFTIGPWLAGGLAAAACVPIVLWNEEHAWVSFLFQTAGRVDHTGIRAWWAMELGLGQMAALTPFVAVGFAAALAWWIRALARTRDVRALWLVAFAAPLLLGFGTLSLWMQVKLNWLLPSYFAVLVGFAGWFEATDVRGRWPRTVRVGSWVAGFHAVVLLAVAGAECAPIAWNNTWSGWDDVSTRMVAAARKLDAEDGVAGNVFCFSSEYEDAGQLEFHAWRDPVFAADPIVVHGQEVTGREGHAAALWDDVEQRLGQDAILVVRCPRGETDRDGAEWTRSCFDSVELLEHVAVTRCGHIVQAADVYVCRNYLGSPRVQARARAAQKERGG